MKQQISDAMKQDCTNVSMRLFQASGSNKPSYADKTNVRTKKRLITSIMNQATGGRRERSILESTIVAISFDSEVANSKQIDLSSRCRPTKSRARFQTRIPFSLGLGARSLTRVRRISDWTIEGSASRIVTLKSVIRTVLFARVGVRKNIVQCL